MATARFSAKAREIGGMLGGPRNVEVSQNGATTTFGTSPRGESSGMLDSMRSVLKRHQCVQQQEALSVCVKQQAKASAKPSALQASSPCQQYVDSLRYCQLVTEQHNYPATINTAFLF